MYVFNSVDDMAKLDHLICLLTAYCEIIQFVSCKHVNILSLIWFRYRVLDLITVEAPEEQFILRACYQSLLVV